MAKTAKVEFSLETIQNNAVTRKQLDGFVQEIIISLDKIKHEKEALADIKKEAHTSLGVPGKVLMKLVRERQDPGYIEAEVHELEIVQGIADAMTGTAPGSTQS